MSMPGTAVEQVYLDILKAVKGAVKVPVSVKLSAQFSNVAHVAGKLDGAGANGLTLFNRFYQPDIDLESLEVKPKILLSTPHALRLPLRWIAILRGHVTASLAATGGIYNAEDAIKMLMAGADVTMLCSALLRHGITHIRTVEKDMARWMQDHEYESVKQMQGSMSQVECADPAAFERAQYVRAVTSCRPS